MGRLKPIRQRKLSKCELAQAKTLWGPAAKERDPKAWNARYERLLAQRRRHMLRQLATPPTTAEEAEDLYQATAATDDRKRSKLAAGIRVVLKEVPDGRGGREIANVIDSAIPTRKQTSRFNGIYAERVGFLWKEFVAAIADSPSFRADLEKALEMRRSFWDLEAKTVAENSNPDRKFDYTFESGMSRWVQNTLVREGLKPLPKEMRPTRRSGRPKGGVRRPKRLKPRSGDESRAVAAISSELLRLSCQPDLRSMGEFLLRELGVYHDDLAVRGRKRIALMILSARRTPTLPARTRSNSVRSLATSARTR